MPDFSLIAFVGPNPLFFGTTNEWGNASFFPQTSSANGYFAVTNSQVTNWVFTATRTGELWFGFNDDAVAKDISDNTGFVSGQIQITGP